MTRAGCTFGVLAAAALSLACALVAPTAHAQASTTTETTEQLADRAYTAPAAGKYADAIAIYLKAYDLSKDSLIPLNIATIYDRKLSERELAEAYYRRYSMASDADPDGVKKVTERLAVLKREDEEARAESAAAPPPPPTSPLQAPPAAPADASHTKTPAPDSSEGVATGSTMRTAGIIVGAVGVAGVGASLLLGYAAKNKNDDANALCSGASCSSQSGVDLAKTGGTYATVSTIAFISGLVFIGGGITLYALAPSSSPSTTTAGIFLSPRVDLTGAGLALHGAF